MKRVVLVSWFLFVSLGLADEKSPQITVFAGTGEKGYSGDKGEATKAKLNNPFDVAFDKEGNLYFSDTFNHCVRRVEKKSGMITTVAGNGKKGYTGDGNPAIEASMNEPYGIELDQEGNLFIVDRLNYCIRRVNPSGKIETVAGTGKSGYSGDGGPATKAQFKEPNGLCLDGKGKLYIADVADQRVRVVDLKSGIINTFCGTGKKEHKGDGGPYAEASLFGPRAVAIGPDGSLFICEREGNCIRKVDFQLGKIDQIAGTGKKGYAGDGALASEATFNGPKELDVDDQGNIFVVDTENQAIRRIDVKSGIITTVAGCGKRGGEGDGGPATKALLGRPHGVVVTKDGTLFIGDTENHKIRRVNFEK
jgi:streptogramin lyase